MFLDNREELEICGIVFNIENYHVHDGRGIRTNVFLKGCNLRCPWCCNPESLTFAPQLATHKNLCQKCSACCRSVVCQQEAECIVCGVCAEACPHEAMEVYGKSMTVAEVMTEVEKDSRYYIQSGGGMTISGGEPCMQPAFTRGLAQAARRRYIHVAMETAAAVPFDQMWQSAEFVDEILLDVKFTDPKKFETISNVPLDTVKENIRELRKRDKYVRMRCPIIPEANDDEAHTESLIQWAKELGVQDADILPFHQLGKHKYASLDYPYALGERKDLDKEKAEQIKARFVAAGIHATVGG